MATSIDKVTMLIGFRNTDMATVRMGVTNNMISHGVLVSELRTGWAQQDGVADVFIVVEFAVPKNTFNDAQLVAIGNELAVITGAPIFRILKVDGVIVT